MKAVIITEYYAHRYVATKHSKRGTELDVEVRGKRRKATVTKMPFVPTRYWRGDGVPSQ
jgi:aminomethyltransferase